MTSFELVKGAAFLAALAFAAPAVAQDVDTPVPAEAAADQGGNNFTLGLGAMYRPSYEGSNDYEVGPAGLVRGRVSGFNFYMRGTNLYVDLIRDRADAPVSFEAGPLVNVRLDRTSSIKDDQVRALGELDTAVEVGGFVGATMNGVFHGYDWLGFRLDVTKDVTDTHGSTIFSPSIEYATPLSRTFLAALSLSAEHVGDDFANTYFGVTPAGALASGLDPYELEGGFKNVRATLLLTQSLSGDLRSGWALFGLGSYSRLLGDFKRSPIVADAGDADQFFVAAGVAYTF